MNELVLKLDLSILDTDEKVEEAIQKYCDERQLDRNSLYPTNIKYDFLDYNETESVTLVGGKYWEPIKEIY